MSERCNVLRTLTAALCCFYQKSSVIGAKVSDRQTGIVSPVHTVAFTL